MTSLRRIIQIAACGAPLLAALVGLVAASPRAGADEPPRPELRDDARGPLVVAQDVAPGHVMRRCIGITNTGSGAAKVAMHLAGAQGDEGLGRYVMLSIDRGRRPRRFAGGGCRGFQRDGRRPRFFRGRLADLPSDASHAVPDGGRTLSPGDERTYRISWWVEADPDAAGRTMTEVAFAWTAST